MGADFIFGGSKAFRAMVETVDHYAASEWPVLIYGETGVGKELVARRIHQISRRKGSFLPLNCGALPPSLFESELFGYERGAFSGASQSSPGLVRQARSGTLFLDEIGDLDASSQVKLLRFLDSKEVRSVGSGRVDLVDVRLVAATNVDLPEAVALKQFRSDLLERLSVLAIRIPPLRERPEDILLIAGSFLRELKCHFSEDTLHCLNRYDWPGNIRQLRNVLVRAVLKSESLLSTHHLEAALEEEALWKAATGANDLCKGTLAEIEKQVVVTKLRQHQGNRRRTAKDLGIAKSTLHEKLRRWQISHPNSTGSGPTMALV